MTNLKNVGATFGIGGAIAPTATTLPTRLDSITS